MSRFYQAGLRGEYFAASANNGRISSRGLVESGGETARTPDASRSLSRMKFRASVWRAYA